MAPSGYKALVKEFNALPEEIRGYFEDADDLIENGQYEISIAYLFQKVETAQNMALYCGMVKLHRVDKDIAWAALDRQHMTREYFRDMVGSIFGKTLPEKTVEIIEGAEEIRDRLMHGKSVRVPQKRQAISDIFKYAELLNEFCYAEAGFKPIGDLRGFSGRRQPLSKSTSRLVAKGLGFTSIS